MIMSFEYPYGGWVIAGPRLIHVLMQYGLEQPDDTGTSAPFIDPGSESLRGDRALYREFIEVEPTDEGVRSFLAKHADLGRDPHAVFRPRMVSGHRIALFVPDQENPRFSPVCHALALRRATRLWDMVRRNEQARLRHYIRMATPEDYARRHPDEAVEAAGCYHMSISPPDDPAQGQVFIYDSHPDLPPGEQQSPPHFRERSYILGLDAEAKPVGRGKEIDMRPVARAYLTGVINTALAGGLSAKVIEDPEKHGRMELRLVPRTSLYAFWCQFAEEVTGGLIPAKCPVCGEWFRPVKHRDRMYCSKQKCTVKAFRIRQRAKELRKEGMSIKKVAEELKLDLADLQKLLSAQQRED